MHDFLCTNPAVHLIKLGKITLEKIVEAAELSLENASLTDSYRKLKYLMKW